MTRDHVVSPPVDQGEVIAWLGTPHGPGRSVERIDTHSSVVFLEGDRAYKLKREVRYDYLDYSTSERRREACLEEVSLNRRTAPSLYLGVRAVTFDPDGGFALDGAGVPVDWVVEMVRFDDSSLLSRLAERGALDIELMPPLATAIARFHDVAAWRFDAGGYAGLRAIIEGNADGLADAAGRGLDAATVQRVTDASCAAIETHRGLLEQRRRSGFVRRGHGDLHLGNVCVVDGVPTLFDCIEFNDALASVDVLYDTAFVLMDLWHRGLTRHASELFNHYLRGDTDLQVLRLLPLFLSARAMVRAKTSLTAATVQQESRAAAHLVREAKQYLELAETLLAARPARLVAIGGLSGSGKTTLARRLAPDIGPAPGAVVLRSDVIRKQLLAVDPMTPLGPEGYTDSVNHLVYRTLAGRAQDALEAGHGVIVDAVFGDARDRAVVADVGKACDAPVEGVWLDAPAAVMEARLRNRSNDESDATPEVLHRQQRRASVPDGWTHVETGPDPDHVHERALASLG